MRQEDNHNDDYKHGNVIFELELHKQEDGRYEASSNGLSVIDYNPDKAVLSLQDQLQAALANGSLRPDGM